MPRPVAASTPHPSPRFRDKIRLRQGRRGPADMLWSATFCVGGEWQTKKPISLGTSDFDDACEIARDRYAQMDGRGVEAVLRPYAVAKPEVKRVVPNAFSTYAERAIADLEARRAVAKAEASGKAKNFTEIIRRIRADLLPRWGETDITKLTEYDLNDWIADEYRVGDQERKATRSSLGNLDWALRHVWQEAVADRVVERRTRPTIDKGLGADGKTRAFIDREAVLRIGRLMSNTWVETPPQDGRSHSVALKRTFRAYLALLASTGIRAGLEANRIRIGYVRFLRHHNDEYILITVEPRQGKHHKGRDVIVYEGEEAFDVRQLLRDLIAARRDEGAVDRDYLFARNDGTFHDYRDVWDDVTSQTNCKIDPMNGETRVPYSLRHYFATECIARGLTIPQVAEWLGTSSQMVERHYKRFVLQREAHNLNGRSGRLLAVAKAQTERLLEMAKATIEPWESADDIEEDDLDC